MIRKFLAFALLVLMGAPVHGQGIDTVTVPLISDYDLDATSYTFCVTTGLNDQVLGKPRPGFGRLTTSGSSTTVTAMDTTGAGQAPFAALAVGDEITVNYSGATPGGTVAPLGPLKQLVVTAKASDTSITVHTAVNLSLGYSWNFRKRSCGTASTDGWVPVHGFNSGNFQVQIDQINVTGGIDYKVECKLEGASSQPIVVIGPSNKTAAYGGGNVFSEPWDWCRVGWKIGTSDDGTDTGAAQEKVSVYFSGRR